MKDISSHLKKEYKKITGNTLALTDEGEVDADVTKISNVRVTCVANKIYKIGGLDSVVDRLAPSEDRLEKNFKTFIELGAWGEAPQNKEQKGQH